VFQLYSFILFHLINRRYFWFLVHGIPFDITLRTILPCWNLRGPIHLMDHPASRKGPDSTIFTNIFHTLHTKLGIKYFEQHLVLKYRGCLHRYIETEMDFMDIASLGRTYRYVLRGEILDLQTPHSQSREKVAPTRMERDRENVSTLRTTSQSCSRRREMKR
jgi:hypothetical protein